MTERTCSRCANPISGRGKTGLCVACNNKEPAIRRALLKAGQEWRNDPAKLTLWKARLAAAAHRRAADPVKGPAMRAHGRKMAEFLHSPEGTARAQSPEAIQRRGRSITEHYLGWCPPDYRDLYRVLTGKGKLTAKEARRAIEEEIKAARRRKLEAMSPFERQMLALERGAKLVEMPNRATLDRPGVFHP